MSRVTREYTLVYKRESIGVASIQQTKMRWLGHFFKKGRGRGSKINKLNVCEKEDEKMNTEIEVVGCDII